MRRLLPLSLLALAGLAARVAVAEDAPTYTFPEKTTWKVGDVVTRSETEKQAQKLKVVMGEAVLQQGDSVAETAFEAVLAVKEVDDAGEFTKALAYFRSWKRSAGADVDDSLTGMHVEITGAGASRGVKVVTPDAKVSPAAAAWLVEKFANDGSQRPNLFLPPKPVAVGETWTLDPAAVRETFGKGGFKFADDKGTATATLAGVEGKVGTTKVEIDLPVVSLTSPQGTISYADAPVFAIRATLRNAVEASLHEKGGEMTVRFQGKGTAVGGPGVTVDLDIDVTNTGSVHDGGEMPPLAAAPAGK